jgi:hypothetical protein
MFSKSSRYRNLPESSPVDAQGERLRGKGLRLTPPTPARFLHTVHESDRLDLLAFKYYGDPSRWWQISDANSEFDFPADLLDRRPVVEELLALRATGFAERVDDLRIALGAFGEVRREETSSFDETAARNPEFLEATLTVIYAPSPATRGQIVAEINDAGAGVYPLRLLRTFAWDQAGQTAEAFTFEAPSAKLEWRRMVEDLTASPAVLELQSLITAATVRIVYHSEMLARQAILNLIATHGFGALPESATLSRIGAQIVIPPNRVG